MKTPLARQRVQSRQDLRQPISLPQFRLQVNGIHLTNFSTNSGSLQLNLNVPVQEGIQL
jgi:hypothetical protein